MKWNKYSKVKMIAAAVLFAGVTFGQTVMQPHHGDSTKPDLPRMERGIKPPPPPNEFQLPPLPNLTKEQKDQLDEIHLKYVKIKMPIHNKLAEKHVRLQSLATADKVDLKAIDNLVSEIGALKIKIMQSDEHERQEIRKVLNDDQRIIFDSHPPVPPAHPREPMH